MARRPGRLDRITSRVNTWLKTVKTDDLLQGELEVDNTNDTAPNHKRASNDPVVARNRRKSALLRRMDRRDAEELHTRDFFKRDIALMVGGPAKEAAQKAEDDRIAAYEADKELLIQANKSILLPAPTGNATGSGVDENI
jgi:hypothetical protein